VQDKRRTVYGKRLTVRGMERICKISLNGIFFHRMPYTVYRIPKSGLRAYFFQPLAIRNTPKTISSDGQKKWRT